MNECMKLIQIFCAFVLLFQVVKHYIPTFSTVSGRRGVFLIACGCALTMDPAFQRLSEYFQKYVAQVNISYVYLSHRM
jgi:hypothetical protein